MLLDSRPSGPNKAIQMETQYVPAVLSKDAKGETYARIAPTAFPVEADGTSLLMHRVTAYKKDALWNDVKRWFPAQGALSHLESKKGNRKLLILAIRSCQELSPSLSPNDDHFGIAHPRAKTDWDWLAMLVTVTLTTVYVLTVWAKLPPAKRVMRCPECGGEITCLGFVPSTTGRWAEFEPS